MNIIGMDAGSISVKVVVLDAAGNAVFKQYRKHKGHPLRAALDLLREACADGECGIAVTGSAGKLIARALGAEPLNELVAQSHAAKKLHPRIRTIIEMGGEDSKLILLGEEGMQDFAMNSVCAAGTGSFLDQQAERLRLSIEEFSDLALRPPRPPRIAGRCSVFAKSDMIHLQQIATPVEEIVAGLCFAVARNFKGSIARGRKIVPPVSFQGGVAANKGMVRAFREVLELDELFVPPDFALLGALGAALKAREDGTATTLRIGPLVEYLACEKTTATGHPSLLADGDSFQDRHVRHTRDVVHALSASAPRTTAYMGIDVGSISTNVAVIDSDGRLLSKRYLMTAGRPIEAVRQGLRETAEELGDRVEIAGVGTTGSGRYMIADYLGADIVKNEITAQATAAAFIDPSVDTIFEIGGQDSKYISLENGVIVDFEMNKACAAGTGSFLEEQAEKLSVSVKGEFADRAFASPCPTRLGERCTVFMENSLMANLQRGTVRNDLLAGLAYSIVQNYINRVVAGKRIGKNIFFQGGVAFNKAVVAAFEKHLGRTLTVPPNHDVTGAIGMALIAMRHMPAAGTRPTAFRGFARAQRPYGISSFACGGCPNMCEINRVKVDGEERQLFYGGRCEKYDISRKDTSHIPDLFKFRDTLLWRSVEEQRARHANNGKVPSRGKIGIPYAFFFTEQLPYWVTFLDALGFDLEVSPHPNRQIVDLGLEGSLSEACYPVKVAIGHLRHLKALGVEAIFLPSFVNLNGPDDEYELGAACPHAQSIPYVGRMAVPGVAMISPVVDRGRDRASFLREMLRSLRRFKVSAAEVRRAAERAEQAQAAFAAELRRKGNEVLAHLNGKAIVILGRPYNALDRGMNLRIPEKLAALGVLAIPMDMLALDEQSVGKTWPNMYWRSGQKMFRAARIVAGDERLFPIVVGNFSCGPDSFILKHLPEALAGKPFLHVEIDEHSADAGIITRCEAYLDSIEHRRPPALQPVFAAAPPEAMSLAGRTVYIPHMTDHACVLAAVFQESGIAAEVLPESDSRTAEAAARHVSGKECYPCHLTTGDMVKKALADDFDPSRSAFFMPSGSGPCRFGQYNVFHRRVLEHLGFSNVPVFAPNQDQGLYQALEGVSKGFVLLAWKGIVAVELLLKCLHETRPYERVAGTSDVLYKESLSNICAAVRNGGGDLEQQLADVRKRFESVPRRRERRPVIGVVGEIYVRLNRFANDNLISRIEAAGGEAWLTSFEEWLYYINAMSIRNNVRSGNLARAARDGLKRFVQARVERRFAGRFEGFLRTLHEPSTRQVLRRAAPYMPDTFEGEAVLSIGKSIDLAEKSVAGIINAIPFGCMPGTIVAGMMQVVKREHDIPFITIPYDGTESATSAIQFEAFMDQARARSQKRNGRSRIQGRA